MTPGPQRQLWKIGDRVRFANEHPDGPVRVISGLSHPLDDPMVEIEGFSGFFAVHLFIDANYPPDSIVPRPGGYRDSKGRGKQK